MTAVVRRMRLRRAAAVAPLLVLALAGTACGRDVDEGPRPTLSGADTTTLSTTNGFYGQVVSDGGGRTLYQFDGDQPGRSTCNDQCAQVWQPFIATGEPQPQDLNVNPFLSYEITLIDRQDGAKQVAYRGHPLYFYSGDKAPADVSGVGRQEFGGKWTGVTTLGDPVIP